MLLNILFLDPLSYRLPRMVTNAKQFESGSYYPVCPRCKTTLDREYVSFCDRCGQHLSWLFYNSP